MNIEELIAAAEALGLSDLTLRALRMEKSRALRGQVLDALQGGQTVTSVASRTVYVSGEHLGQLARKFGFRSPQDLNDWLRQNGVPARSGKGRQKALT